MRRIVRLHDYSSGHFIPRRKQGDEQIPYARFEGYNSLGKKTVFFAYGDQALAFDAAVDQKLERGRELHEAGLYVEVSGDMVDGKRRADGRKMPPYFKVREFDFLEGPALESRRLRHQMAEQVAEADRLAAEGNLEQAFEKMRDFMARESAVVLATAPEAKPEVKPAAAAEQNSPPQSQFDGAAQVEEPVADSTVEETTAIPSSAEVDTSKVREAPEDSAPPEERAAAAFNGLEGDMVFVDDGPEEEAAREMNLDGSADPTPRSQTSANTSGKVSEAPVTSKEAAPPQATSGATKSSARAEGLPSEKSNSGNLQKRPTTPFGRSPYAFGGFGGATNVNGATVQTGAQTSQPAAAAGSRHSGEEARPTKTSPQNSVKSDAAKPVSPKPAFRVGSPFASPFGR